MTRTDATTKKQKQPFLKYPYPVYCPCLLNNMSFTGLQDATNVPDPYTPEGLNVSYDGCVAFDSGAGESVTLATVTQGTTAGGISSITELPLGDIDDPSLEGT